MGTQEIVERLINGQTVSILDTEQKKEVQKKLREIKKNCSICLSQLNEQLKYHGVLRQK